MHARSLWLIPAFTLAVCATAAVTDDQVVARRFPLAAGGPTPEIAVSLIHGSIRVATHNAAEIVLDAKAHLEASDAARLAKLKSGVRLESEQAGQNVWIGVEVDRDSSGWDRQRRELGWRSNAERRRERGDRSSAGDGDREFSRFNHEVSLRVPRGAHLKLRTVNGGEIDVTGVEGEFDISNVNGGIALHGVAGQGRIHTVNGAVNARFAALPAGEISARTVNGPVTLSFPPGLNATLKMHSQHGEISTDFPLTALASGTQQPPQQRQSASGGMKRIWRFGPPSTLRAGNGTGPTIEARTLNGPIRILENRN